MTEWITWAGGECPIPDAKAGEYEIKFDQDFTAKPPCDAIQAEFCFGFAFGEIIAYRLIEKEQSDLDWLEEKVRAEFDYQSDKYQSYVRVATREAFRKVLDLIKERKEAKS
jgi:hypothetical protein